MRLFRRKNKNIDRVDDFVIEEYEQMSDVFYQKQLEEESELIPQLDSIHKQLDNAKNEYQNTLEQLTPLKWELLDKQNELARLKSECDLVSSQLEHDKSELEQIQQKISHYSYD